MEFNKLNIVLFKPEIAMNVGNIMRTCSCLDLTLHLIEPFGFPLGKHGFFPTSKDKRTAMDYECRWYKYNSWECFLKEIPSNGRLIGITPHTSLKINEIKFKDNDILIFGRESDGFDDESHGQMNILASIPMAPHQRSFNVTTSIAIVLGSIFIY